MKRKAKHAALQELANMMLPSLMEDVDTSEMMKTMPAEVKQAVKKEEPKEEKKPKIKSFSLTTLMADQRPVAKPKKEAPKKRGFLKKSR